MISVLSWPILREKRILYDLISLPFPETPRSAHITWVLSAYLMGSKDLISLFSFSAASNIDLCQGKKESYFPVFISWTMGSFKQYVISCLILEIGIFFSLRPFPGTGSGSNNLCFFLVSREIRILSSFFSGNIQQIKWYLMISVLSWPILREKRILYDLISLPFPETARSAHIMWLLSACMRGNNDLISVLSFSAGSIE